MSLLSDAIVATHPRLCVIRAWQQWGRFAVEKAMHWVQEGETALAQKPYPALAQVRQARHELLAVRALLTAYTSDPDFASHAYADQGVSLCERGGQPYQMLISYFVRLRIQQAQGDWDGVWATWQTIGRRWPLQWQDCDPVDCLEGDDQDAHQPYL